MPNTTLNAIREHGPCADGWKTLLSHLGKTAADDEPLSLLTILDSNGLDDALWCLRAMPEHNRHWRLYAVWCARQVQHPMTDARSIAALDAAERHANGLATDQELSAARAAALGRRQGRRLGRASRAIAQSLRANRRFYRSQTMNTPCTKKITNYIELWGSGCGLSTDTPDQIFIQASKEASR